MGRLEFRSISQMPGTLIRATAIWVITGIAGRTCSGCRDGSTAQSARVTSEIMPAFYLTGMYPSYLYGPSGVPFNFADAGHVDPRHRNLGYHWYRGPHLFWLSRRFDCPECPCHERNHACVLPDWNVSELPVWAVWSSVQFRRC